ncbi:uncharacterized protein FOMMEDRAFT_130679 [Fomitiporia mediterranea MF3/22]|uniref:uncharacterized protein n=1 Tax=Fomitiporia mediterranea (strain MF3/22) TaxID=694068 RepID=UPI0004408D3D|nr:uncharacterized protein FOMMEDRAFT_130679 [Fomitiporia mediterranea MF3/22]EJD07511.1 hypothetical protein FOMMEDRAFT_130679 [Fomitiporia mediterranea MF3/22]
MCSVAHIQLFPFRVLPQADEQAAEDAQERRTPAPKKKNRVKLGTTKEEDETPPASPTRIPVELSTSPPYETKVRQISRKVRGMKWDDKDRPTPELSQDMIASAEDADSRDPNVELEAAAEISPMQRAVTSEQSVPATDESLTSTETVPESQVDERPPPDSTLTMDSDLDDQEKGLKRKIGDRQASASLEEQSGKARVEASKRSRDDHDEDDNPREKKRPTPPPEELDEESAEQDSKDITPDPSQTGPVAPQPKVGGFLAYAATSSPFASAKGPSVFGQKSTPSPSPLAGTSNGSASSFSSAFAMKQSSPFAIPGGSKPSSTTASALASPSPFSSNTASASASNNLSTSPTGTKRSGFEAFASAASPFAAASRSKSPPSGLGLARSKSPTRRGPGSSINAFKSYAGSGTQSFSAPSPPIKKQRHDSGEDAENEKSVTRNALDSTSNGASPESSESEEKAEQPTFADRLRAETNVLESQEGNEDEGKIVVTEREVQTGEEEEDTIFQVRGKLYALSEQNAWKERGTGLLKLNVRKSDGCNARLVMRKEAVFTLLLNVTLFKGMRCTIAQDPRYVRFSCIESGKTIHYNLRLSNAKVASELIEEVNANIPSDEPGDAV